MGQHRYFRDTATAQQIESDDPRAELARDAPGWAASAAAHVAQRPA